MKLLVTGAGGDIGLHLTGALVSQGHTVRALVRNIKEAERVRGPGVEIYTADITDPKTLDGAAAGVDATYHMAAALFVVDPEEQLRKINYEGTINVANECIDKGVKRFIFPSFPLVLGPHTTPSKPVSVENAPGQPNSYHALYKRLCEQHLEVLDEHGKLSVTILRFGTVYGPQMRFIKTLKPLIRRGFYFIPGTGDNLAHFAHVDDVVQGLLLALASNRAAGNIYNIADDMPVRFKQFIFELARLMNAPKPGTAPVWLFRIAAALANGWARARRTAPLINNDILTFSISDFAADTSRSKDELGFRPKYPTIYEGLPTCVGDKERKTRSATG